MGAGARLFDAGVPDWRGLQAIAVRWRGPDRRQFAGLLHGGGRGSGGGRQVRVQRHVAAVSGCAGRTGPESSACAGSISSRGATAQGGGRNSGRGGTAAEGGRVRSGAQALALVPFETPREFDGQADREAARGSEVQSAYG